MFFTSVDGLAIRNFGDFSLFYLVFLHLIQENEQMLKKRLCSRHSFHHTSRETQSLPCMGFIAIVNNS